MNKFPTKIVLINNISKVEPSKDRSCISMFLPKDVSEIISCLLIFDTNLTKEVNIWRLKERQHKVILLAHMRESL